MAAALNESGLGVIEPQTLGADPFGFNSWRGGSGNDAESDHRDRSRHGCDQAIPVEACKC